MVIINGKVYGDNVTIVNGRVITGKPCDDSACKKFDETKKESANGVNRITIDSNVNVKVSTCDTNEITAHLHGSAIMDNDLELSVTKRGDEIRVSVETDGVSNSYNNMSIISGNSIISQSAVVINNFGSGSNGGLMLDVQIPAKAFEEISVESTDANIDVSSSVNANSITAESKNGNIDVSATFQNLTVECKSGNVDVDSEAHCNVKLNVTSKNGNVDVTIGNIGTSNVSVASKNGNCKNNPKLRGIYTVSGCVTSKNGNAKFH